MNNRFRILLCILILFVKIDTEAGGFKCFKYQIEFRLTNDSVVQGYYLTGNYENEFDFQEETFKDYLLNFTKYGTYSIEVYRKIDTLEYPKMDFNEFDSCDFKLSCAYPDNVIKLKIDSIKSVKLINIAPCGVCGIDDKKNGYYWNGLEPQIITELNASEIELLKDTKPIFDYQLWFEKDITTCNVLSYNKEIGEAEFKNICAEIKKEIENSRWDSYNQIKADLRLKGIILIIFGSD